MTANLEISLKWLDLTIVTAIHRVTMARWYLITELLKSIVNKHGISRFI